MTFEVFGNSLLVRQKISRLEGIHLVKTTRCTCYGTYIHYLRWVWASGSHIWGEYNVISPRFVRRILISFVIRHLHATYRVIWHQDDSFRYLRLNLWLSSQSVLLNDRVLGKWWIVKVSKGRVLNWGTALSYARRRGIWRKASVGIT
jgi:hypothetical protein